MEFKKYFIGVLILFVSLDVLFIPLECPSDPIAFTYAGTVKDLRKQLSGSGSDSGNGIKILEEITFAPSLIEPSFWEQSPQEFKTRNPKGAWKEERWGKTELQLQAGSPQAFRVWEIVPVDVTVRFSNNRLSWIRINLWNKGDCNLVDYKAASIVNKSIRERLEGAGIEKNLEKQKVSVAVKRKWNTYRIGKTILSLSFERKEYFIVKLSPAGEKGRDLKETKREISKEKFRTDLKNNLKRESNGDVYICGIPMVEQGEKGYCAPASCARIMLYYGIEVDMHLLADLMNTRRGGGTYKEEIKYSLRLLSRGNPISYKRLVLFKPRKIKKYIDKGIPIIWVIPGHLRLIIGYNDKKREIIYSDSWGLWAKARKMSYRLAGNITIDLYILRSR